MNWHEVMEECALEMDQVVARELRADPARLDVVVAWIERFLADPEYSVHSKDALGEWLELIRSRGLAGVLGAIEDRSEEDCHTPGRFATFGGGGWGASFWTAPVLWRHSQPRPAFAG